MFDYFFGFLCGDKEVSQFVYSHPIVPCTLEMFPVIDHHPRCTLHVIYRSPQSVQLSRKIFLPPFSDLGGMESARFRIDRKRLHIGSKHGSLLVLSEGTTGLPQVSCVSTPKYLAILTACRVGRLRLVCIGLVRPIIW